MIRFIRWLALAVFVSFAAFSQSNVAHSETESAEEAFINFIKAGNYNEAEFYIQRKFVNPETLDVSQIFYNVVKEKYWPRVTDNIQKIDVLYNYLARIGAINLNRVFSCGSNRQYKCFFVNETLAGLPVNTIKFFVDRGMNLNFRELGFVPSSVPVLLRLGTGYSVEQLNALVAMGLVLGDETFPIEELNNYRDDYLRSNSLNMPANYLELNDQNLLDVAVIALGTSVSGEYPVVSLRRKTLCEFITYAASSYQPSFDYLLYLLNASETFRGANVGKTEKSGNRIYQPFPSSCVTLIQNMAASHAQLQTVISDFANRGDVSTAQWLISIQRGGE